VPRHKPPLPRQVLTPSLDPASELQPERTTSRPLSGLFHARASRLRTVLLCHAPPREGSLPHGHQHAQIAASVAPNEEMCQVNQRPRHENDPRQHEDQSHEQVGYQGQEVRGPAHRGCPERYPTPVRSHHGGSLAVTPQQSPVLAAGEGGHNHRIAALPKTGKPFIPDRPAPELLALICQTIELVGEFEQSFPDVDHASGFCRTAICVSLLSKLGGRS